MRFLLIDIAPFLGNFGRSDGLGRSRPFAPDGRFVLKTTVANLEVERPAGKWENVAGASYDVIAPDPNMGIPRGLGLVSVTGSTKLMQENKDRQVFANFGQAATALRPTVPTSGFSRPPQAVEIPPSPR